MRLRWLLVLAIVSCGSAVQPISAQLPAPPATPLALHFRAEFRRLSRETCAQKAMDAMVNKENFISAEIDKDGNAWGCNETTIVRVFTLPFKDGANVILVACGKDNKEAERICNAVRAHIADADVNPKAPAHHQCNDTTRKSCGLKLRSSQEQRTGLPTVRFFSQAAAIVMEKNGLNTNIPGAGMVVGGNPSTVVMAFAAPGPNDVSVQFGAVAISPDEVEADRLHNVIRSGVVKVLFD